MFDLREGIQRSAQALGVSPVDLATAISYETAGTFDPTKAGPTTQWGQHRGLIQWGEPQAQKYGVDWSNPVGSQLGEDGAVVKYLRDTGVQPGMGLLDIYSAINAGGVGRYGASDANNGGAPGTVRDKVEKQMAGHRRKAEELFGGSTPGFMAGSEGSDRMGAPMQQQDQERRGLFGIKPELAMALAGGFANLSRPGSGNQFLQNAYVTQARGQKDAKSKKSRNQTAEWLRGNGYGEFADLVEGGAVSGGDVMSAIMQQRLAAPKDNRTSALKEYEYAKTQGYDGSFIDFQQAKNASGSGTEFGLNPQYGVDENGNPVILQLGKDGTAAQTELPPGVTFQKEPIKIDGGTDWILLDPISRQPVGSIPKNLEEAAADTARGRELGKAEGENAAAASADYQKAQSALNLIADIRNDPNRVRATGKSAMFNAIPGTEGYDFERKVEQAKGGAFLAAIDAMRGMGALSDAEGQAARQAITRMDTAMTEQGFLDALDDYEFIVKQALSSAAQRGGGPAPVDAGDGQGAGAPATGEVVDGYQFLGGDPSDPSRWSKVTR